MLYWLVHADHVLSRTEYDRFVTGTAALFLAALCGSLHGPRAVRAPPLPRCYS